MVVGKIMSRVTVSTVASVSWQGQWGVQRSNPRSCFSGKLMPVGEITTECQRYRQAHRMSCCACAANRGRAAWRRRADGSPAGFQNAASLGVSAAVCQHGAALELRVRQLGLGKGQTAMNAWMQLSRDEHVDQGTDPTTALLDKIIPSMDGERLTAGEFLVRRNVGCRSFCAVPPSAP